LKCRRGALVEQAALPDGLFLDPPSPLKDACGAAIVVVDQRTLPNLSWIRRGQLLPELLEATPDDKKRVWWP
jgi:hypothetical protein